MREILKPTRRALLGCLAAAAPLAAVAGAGAYDATSPPHPDAALLALGREMDAARAVEDPLWARLRAAAPYSAEEASLETEADAAGEAVHAIVRRIEAAPARTLDGLLVKGRAVRWCRTADFLEPCRDASTDERLLWSLARDLEAIGRA